MRHFPELCHTARNSFGNFPLKRSAGGKLTMEFRDSQILIELLEEIVFAEFLEMLGGFTMSPFFFSSCAS